MIERSFADLRRVLSGRDPYDVPDVWNGDRSSRLMKAFQACLNLANRSFIAILYLLSSLKRLLVCLIRDIGVHQGRHIVDLLFGSFLEKLSVSVGVFQSDRVTHRK